MDLSGIWLTCSETLSSSGSLCKYQLFLQPLQLEVRGQIKGSKSLSKGIFSPYVETIHGIYETHILDFISPLESLQCCKMLLALNENFLFAFPSLHTAHSWISISAGCFHRAHAVRNLCLGSDHPLTGTCCSGSSGAILAFFGYRELGQYLWEHHVKCLIFLLLAQCLGEIQPKNNVD